VDPNVEGGDSADDWPEGWPGEALLEGRTRCDLPAATPPTEESARRHGSGPATRAHRSVFHNPAMAACRTRSVLLMDAVIRSGMLGDGRIRALDGLGASGLRARRWLNETSAEVSARIDATVCDLDATSLGWAAANHRAHPPDRIHRRQHLQSSRAGSTRTTAIADQKSTDFGTMLGDLRQRVHDGGWQWLDIDPFGSPIPFLDSAIQSTSRRAVIEVTATDVAALVGSKPAAGLRRYGARVRLDGLAHDSGLRVLIASIAKICAKHDRGVEPLMSVWESHHLRTSLFIRRSAEGGNEVQNNIGWRVAEPTHAEIEMSMAAGLHPFGSSKECEEAPTQPHALLPLSYPIDRNDPRISGPLWIGPLHSSSILEKMTEEKAESLCTPSEVDFDVFNNNSTDDEAPFHLRVRAIRRAVRGLAEEASLPANSGLFLTDHIHHHTPISTPPSPARVVDYLCEAGHPAAVARYGEPAFRTAAPWAVIVAAVTEIAQ